MNKKFKEQIGYNKRAVEEVINDKFLTYTVSRLLTGFKVESLDSMSDALLERIVKTVLAQATTGRVTPNKRAGVIMIIAERLGEPVKLMTGYCLDKNSTDYDRLKKEYNAETSVPNYTYVEYDGKGLGVLESLDFIDVVEV